MSHRNARTTYLGRLLIIERYRDGWPKAHIASAMGISRKCVSTWVTRYETEGEAGLHDRSSRPHTMPTRTAAEVEARIVALRTRERRGRTGSRPSSEFRPAPSPGFSDATRCPTWPTATR
nr:leucine zipper domain-containing protein [Rhodococcus sp. HS-D2]